jgi:hypothetical protein
MVRQLSIGVDACTKGQGISVRDSPLDPRDCPLQGVGHRGVETALEPRQRRPQTLQLPIQSHIVRRAQPVGHCRRSTLVECTDLPAQFANVGDPLRPLPAGAPDIGGRQRPRLIQYLHPLLQFGNSALEGVRL